MSRWLLALLLGLGSMQLHAQRFLTLPDLSTLTRPESGQLSVDPRSGLIYATNFSTLLSGVKTNGLGRVFDGIPDLSWRPALRLYVQGAPVFAPNGNVYVVGQTAGSVNGVSVVSVSTAPGSEPVVRFTPPAPDAVGARAQLLAIAGGYDHWLYFTTRESVGINSKVRIGRLDTRNHQVDSWTYELPLEYSIPVVGADGAVYMVSSSTGGDAAWPRIFMRLSTVGDATPLWRQEIFTARSKVEADARGRLYVLTKGTYGYQAEIIRLDANGELDTAWTSQQSVNSFLALSATGKNFDMLATGDELLVTISRDVVTGSLPVEMARFDNRGAEVMRATLPAAASAGRSYLQRPLMGVANGAVHFATADAVWLFDVATLRLKNSYPYVLGGTAEVYKVLALPDGGRLILGQFDAFYGGQRYRNLLRIGADGNVRQDWRVTVDGNIQDAFLTPRGVVVFGSMTSINGVAASNSASSATGFFKPSVALVSLASGASVDPQWGAQWPRSAYQITYDGADQFYAASGTPALLSLQALSVSNNMLSPEWSVPFRGEGVSLDTDRLGGLWLFWDVSGFGNPTVNLIERFDFAVRAQTASIPNRRISFQTRSLLSSRQHAYIAEKRYGLTQASVEDPAWQRRPATSDSGWAAQTLSANYLYWTQLVDQTNTLTLRRSSLSGNGDADPAWSAPAPRTAGLNAAFTKDVELQSSDDIEYVASQGDDIKMITTRSLTSEDKTVIEYFSRDAGRYFLTGRADEQSTLDALPASFVRTGMRFGARSAASFADRPETPICRFYAAPDRGGSNTHFYGTGDDCALLNTSSALRFEGFDFAATKPTGTVCSAPAPNAVYRLFNNKSATNEGNHRYVVSAATKAKMLALGWVDEGAVFCSVNVTDAVLAQ